MKRATPLRSLCLAAAALTLPLFAACEGDEPGPDGNNNPDTPLYAFTTQVISGEESQSYVVLTDTVDHSEPLSLVNSIEIPGRALGVGVAKSGTLFVAGDEGPTVTRYELTSEGRLEQKGNPVSFAGKGVAQIGEYQNQFQFVSETKAYYFDNRTSQVIIWNPQEMTVTGSIPINGLAVAGATTTFATHPVRRPDQVIMPVGWRLATGAVTKQAGVIVLDTKNDTATLKTDDRCGYVRDGVVGPDGMVYLATEVYGAAVYRVAGGETPVPCLLRFNPQTLEFDASFFKELSSFVGGGTVGSLLPGPQGTAYLRVLDESVYTVQPGAAARVVASASAWRWWQLRLDTLTATRIEGLPATTGSTFLFQAGDRTVYTEFTSGSAATNVRDLSDQSGKVTMNLKGISFSFLQVR